MPGLAPGIYTVFEEPAFGWDLQPAQTITVGQAPECNATVAFSNRERGAITITKQTTPDTCGKRWRFDALDLGPFSLRGGQSMPFAELTATQVYTIYETNLPNGWALEIQCEGASVLREVVRDSIEAGDEGESCEGEQSESGEEHTGGPPKDYGVEILLAPGEQVSCTFHNMRKPQIRVVKLEDADADGILTGDEAPLARWKFSIYQQVDGIWQQIKKIKSTAADGMTTFGALKAGEYLVCESPQLGWLNTVPGAANVAPPALLAKGYACQTTTVEGEFGFRRYLRFGNVRAGNVAIEKTTSPSGGGDFEFTHTINEAGSFMLSDGGILPFINIRPGAYTVTEAQLPNGWALAQIQCSDGNSLVPSVPDLQNRAVTLNVEPGETVLCTFVNVQSGNVEIGVVTNPPDGAGFAFDQSIDGTGSFTLDDSVARGFPNVAPGAYLINQAAPSGWVLDAILCDDAASALASVVDPTGQAVTVQVEPGEDVSCQFLFSALGTVVIEKQTDPPGGEGFLFRPGIRRRESDILG